MPSFTQLRLITVRPSSLHASGSGVSLNDSPDLKLLILVGLGGASCLLLDPTGFSECFSFAPDFALDVVWFSRDFQSLGTFMIVSVSPRF